ncbi:MAG: NAD+ synthase [Actinobacteria bacterium]|nr:NAD+ synthase [Actinomycetota bacterium]
MGLRIALAQINPVVGDIDGNVGRILDAWQAAHDAGADLVVFPELAVTGYPPEDLLLRPDFVDASASAVDRLADQGPSGTVAVVGHVRVVPTPEDTEDWDVAVAARTDLRNSASVLSDGRAVGVYDKARLPNYGVFDEGRYFTPDGDPLTVNVAGVPVGVTICEDLWSETGPVSESAAAGARMVVNLNASPFQRGKRSDRDRWIEHHVRHDGVVVAYVNCVGGQDELVFDGGSVVVGSDGQEVGRALRFAEDLLVVDVDVAAEPLPGAPELAGFDTERPALPDRERPEDLDEAAEVWEALVLGTRDYCRKNGFERVVLGLSGGIDSSLAAAVAADAIGGENVLGVSMPSTYSTEHSKTDAAELAERLGARYEVIEIERARKVFGDMLADLFAGAEPDVTEENIQARIRGMLLMAISNKFGHLVIATGNKSEASVGYATLYGDMAGGFMPLKDCEKQLVYALSEHRNRFDDGPVIPENVLTKAPSAELAPDQKDEDSLPPYDVLDEILRLYVEEQRSVAAIVEAGFEEATVREVIRMVDTAEFKRRQAPPGVKISARAFGKDRRLPITNGWRG